MTQPLFSAAGLDVVPLVAEQVPLLQRLFDDNPAYFQTVNRRNAHANEAQLEFDERPPPHLSYTRQWMLGVFAGPAANHDTSHDTPHDTPHDTLAGVIIVSEDLGTLGLWHTGLFLLASALHGSGAARALYAAQEAWMQASGARWLRLGVVVGNARAERFWARCGYVELRRRLGVDTGGRINDTRVMFKPLANAAQHPAEIEAYLQRVPRDRPDSTLP